jgi:DnaJ-class molecular chaperone
LKKRKKRINITVFDIERFIKDQKNNIYQISFLSLIRARKKIIEQYKDSFKECTTCSGKGFLPCGDICPTCYGFGVFDIFDSKVFEKCPVCNGCGFKPMNSKDSFSSCERCNGTGILDWLSYLTTSRPEIPQLVFNKMRGVTVK